jgi:hypothetical protein
MVDQQQALAAPSQPPPPPAGPSRSPGWGSSAAPGHAPAEFGHRAGYAVAAIPIAFALLLEVLSHEFLAPLGDNRVSLLGVPAGTFIVSAVLLLTLMGALAVRYVRSPVIVGAVLIFTTSIGLMLVIMGPAVVLIMINLHT